MSKEEPAPTVARGDVVPADLEVDVSWARRQLRASEPPWSTILAPRLSNRVVWIIDAMAASGERRVHLVSDGAPVPVALEVLIAAPLSMSGRRLPADTDLLAANYREPAARLSTGPGFAAAQRMMKADRDLISVRVAPWPILVLKPRFPFTEPYFAFRGPNGHPGFLRLFPRRVGDALPDIS